MGQTVNLLAYAFVGSNPALPTLIKKPCHFRDGVFFINMRSCQAGFEWSQYPRLKNSKTRPKERFDSSLAAALPEERAKRT
jgi:hypothetical protein